MIDLKEKLIKVKNALTHTVDPSKLGVESKYEGIKKYNHRELLLLNPQREFKQRKIDFLANEELPQTFDEYEQWKELKKAIFDDNPLSLWCKDQEKKNGEKRHPLNSMFRGEDSRAVMTDEHMNEWVKCRDDILHFAKYCSITNIDHGQIVVPLRDYQVDLLKQFEGNRNNIVMISRQCGKSTLAALHLAHFICFNDRPSAIVSFTKTSAYEIFDRVKECLEMLPDWVQPSPTKLTENEMHFAHGAKIVARAGSKNCLRGDSYAKVFVDEFAHFEDIESSWNRAIRPVVSSGRRSSIIICSTPKGDNKFKELWDNSVKGETSFKTYENDWRCVQDRQYSEKTGLLDHGEHFKSNEVSTIGRIAFEQEHECSFLSSAQCLFDSFVFDSAVIQDTPNKNTVVLDDGTSHEFTYFTAPIKEHRYTLGIDPAENTGVDSTVITVIDQSITPVEVVATFANSQIYPKQTSEISAALARYYNNAFIFVEVNQPTGGEVIKYLETSDGYQNIYKKNGSSYSGIKLVRQSRNLGCNLLKEVFEEQELVINDSELFKQSMRFCMDIKRKIYASCDGHDDYVMSVMMHSLGLNDPIFHAYWIEDTSHLDSHEPVSNDSPVVIHTGGWGETNENYYSGYEDGVAPSIYYLANQMNSRGYY